MTSPDADADATWWADDNAPLPASLDSLDVVEVSEWDVPAVDPWFGAAEGDGVWGLDTPDDDAVSALAAEVEETFSLGIDHSVAMGNASVWGSLEATVDGLEAQQHLDLDIVGGLEDASRATTEALDAVVDALSPDAWEPWELGDAAESSFGAIAGWFS